ncbi:MAG: UDP-glucose 4-epimerase [Chlamydiae bacterium]|nr:UDP-glucose 4-epimerase [Chlamydiota bacterium]
MCADKIKKILVTGGAGFLGSHLCEQLVAKGHLVICLDNFYTGNRDNISHLEERENFRFIEHDICTSIDIEVDEIYNLACPASPRHYQRDPTFTMRTCVVGVLHMLELAQKNGATLLQASTSEVYGDPAVHPQPESYWGHVNPIGPRACYDEGKRAAETLLIPYKQSKIARIFNTYGPRMQEDDGRVISNFILQALSGEDLTIYGKGEQTRSFCYVDDLISGLILLMESPHRGPINIGNPSEFTIQELADQILELTSSSSKIVYHPLPEDDPKMRCPDIAKAEKELNWKPTIALEEGLKRTISAFKQKSIANCRFL